VVGGLDRFSGPIIGTALLVVAGEFFGEYGFYKIIFYSVLMIVVLLFARGGIAGLLGTAVRKFRRLGKEGVISDTA